MTRRSTRNTISMTAVLATAAAGMLLASPAGNAAPVGDRSAASSAPASAAAPAPSDVTLVRTRTSLTGTHYWYQQVHRGVPVLGGYYVRHVGAAGQASSARDGRVAVPASLATAPAVTALAATGAAQKAVVAKAAAQRSLRAANPKRSSRVPLTTAGRATLAVSGGALVWSVTGRSAEGSTRTLVDARTGAVRKVEVLSRHAEGRGRVFDPNPVVSERNESLTDQNDRNQAVPSSAYKNVILRNLGGSGTLTGTYARIVAAKGGLARSASGSFRYLRASNNFEQVNAYYHVNQTQEYIHRLGFTDVNNESQDVETNTFAGDNSFYDPNVDVITLGEGGVDDAEDAEVVWHEYAHAIQDDQVPGYGQSEEAGAIGEGFGDYWAVTMSVPVSGGFDLPCVMDWDATSYTSSVPHCLRRTDTGKTTDDMTGEVHDDGEIWSNALWDIHQALGRDQANTIILESQFSYAPDTSFADAARDVVASAKSQYGTGAAAVATAAFQARKIL